MQSRRIPETDPAGGPDPGTTLTKAVMGAAGFLGISQAMVASVLGISTASVSRMASGGYVLDAHRKEWEFGVLFVRLFRSLDAILGHGDQARLWLTHDNLALGGKPLELIRTTEGLVRVVHYLDATRGRI
ncbi:MbcA/ParS/Xre antitoxin family protein [Cupriavidus nantongensis]|uniref:XRE family transcriptional regulator n=1 Tax=Cupriavidus nantongensis TaxID=1796606 RepID=A0A142JJ08_9BURK|nr:MbcA/ParS/Xre antitoxin family protein [Cupriavidus nantongensis]AMR78070.1 XRE family transcriptional regulator [Cupriavidus nantongensis]